MESWRHTWRKGIAPQISTRGLEAILAALEGDSDKLIQGATTSPPPLHCVRDWPCEAACITALAGWQGDGLTEVDDIEEYFAEVCFQADQALGEPAGCRFFLNWYDEASRDEMRREMIPEVQLALASRKENPS